MALRSTFCIASTVVMVLSSALGISAQGVSSAEHRPVRLELTVEVATTNEDGSPQALRFLLTNEGNTSVVLPMPSIDCIGGNGRIHIRSKIIAGKPQGMGTGHGCGSGSSDGEPAIVERIRREWFYLRPGESLVLTGDGRSMLDKSEGFITYEYWGEYEPPKLSEADRMRAQEAGYVVPLETVVSAPLTYSERWPSEE